MLKAQQCVCGCTDFELAGERHCALHDHNYSRLITLTENNCQRLNYNMIQANFILFYDCFMLTQASSRRVLPLCPPDLSPRSRLPTGSLPLPLSSRPLPPDLSSLPPTLLSCAEDAYWIFAIAISLGVDSVISLIYPGLCQL